MDPAEVSRQNTQTKRNDTCTPKRYTDYKAVASALKEWAIGPNNEPLRHMNMAWSNGT